MKEYDFYIVPTPIGNLGDITLRAIEILNSVDLIACEDSRNTQKLLNHFNIKTKCISYHKFNEKERVNKITEFIKEGHKVALVSDAGTPLICDPGSVIVKELKQEGFRVTSLPGANAVITFLSQIPREDEKFAFIGFLPKTSSAIKEILNQYQAQDVVFYESPNRIVNTLEIIRTFRGNATISIGRELTKMFEEVITNDIDFIIKHLKNNVSKGEFVVMLHRNSEDFETLELKNKIEILQAKGYSAKDISVIISELFNVNKNYVYKMVKNN